MGLCSRSCVAEHAGAIIKTLDGDPFTMEKKIMLIQVY